MNRLPFLLFATRIGRSRGLLAVVLGALLTLTGCMGLSEGDPQLPTQASTVAPHMDWLFYFIFWVCLFYLVHITAIMLWFMWRYRRRPGVEPQPSPHHNLPLEIAWSIPPAFLVVLFFYWGFTGFVDLKTPPADAYKIECIGKQWDFRYIYPNGTVTTELHVPKGVPVEVILHSEDVLHSFYIPAFRVKQDLVPGRFTEVWFEATRSHEGQLVPDGPSGKLKWEGDFFWMFCAEYCGDGHSRMTTKVVVHEKQEDFERWLASQDIVTPESAYQLYCASCHRPTAEKLVGPGFQGVFGSKRKVLDPASGQTLEVDGDEAYLRESIMQPGKYLAIVGGETYPDQMTKGLGDSMRPEEIDAVIEYIKGLK